MNKWHGLHGPITRELANAEPERDRLFSRPAPRISPELARLLARIERNIERRPAVR